MQKEEQQSVKTYIYMTIKGFNQFESVRPRKSVYDIQTTANESPAGGWEILWCFKNTMIDILNCQAFFSHNLKLSSQTLNCLCSLRYHYVPNEIGIICFAMSPILLNGNTRCMIYINSYSCSMVSIDRAR